MKNLTTPQDRELFGKYVEAYQQLLNLADWRIEHSGTPASKRAMAEMAISFEDKLAVWSFGKDFGALPVNEKTIRQTAMHEVLHVFLRPLIEACETRDETAITAAEHSIVVVLEKLLTRE